MTMIPSHFVGSLAGTSLAQAKGADVDRTKSETSHHDRAIDSIERAEAAAGIGTTQEDSAADERDADGRRLWEIGPDGKRKAAGHALAQDAPLSKDPTGLTGNQLDLSG